MTPKASRFWIVAAGVLLLALALRLVAGNQELWLDEIWTLQLASTMRSAGDVFALHADNNHYLNTLWMYFLGPDAAPLTYHSLAIICGLGTVLMAGIVGLRRSPATAVATMLLIAVSYEMVVFSSEARGYSVMLFTCLAAWFLLNRYLREPTMQAGVLYGLVTVFGLLSHLVFLNFLIAAGLWVGFHSYRAGRTVLQATMATLLLHAIPALACIVLYLVDVRYIGDVGGTPNHSLIDALGASFAWMLGSPRGAAIQLLLCVTAVLLLVTGYRWLKDAGDDSWVFLLTAALLAPTLTIIVHRSDSIYPRYFLVGGFFFLLMLGALVGSWWDRGGITRKYSLAVLGAFVVMNSVNLYSLSQHGRGRYREAIQYMSEHTSTPTVVVGGDQDLRIGLVLEYQAAHMPGTKPVTYLHGQWPAGGAQWFLTSMENAEDPSTQPDRYHDDEGNQYDLVQTFETAPISGLHWFVYRNRSTR